MEGGRSVSELYAADEVELLLEELRGLERPPPAAQDFEIAGSQTGQSVHSWDSHPHYRLTPPPPPARVAPLYCHARHLLTRAGALRLIVAVSSLCCVCLEYGAGGAELWLLPAAGRLRLLLATALFSLMSSSALLFLDISRLVHLFPFNWAKLNAWLYICVGVMYLIAASISMVAVVSDEYWWVPVNSTNMLIASSSFGLIAGLCSGLTALVYCYQRPPAACDSALLGRSPSGSPSPPDSPPARAAYLPVPREPDPLPCSSKAPL